MPNLRFGGRADSELKEASARDTSLISLSSFECFELETFNSCIVAAILGTLERFLRWVCLRTSLENDQSTGNISEGIPPP